MSDAIVPAQQSALSTETTNPMAALAARLPARYREDVLLLKRPTIEELVSSVDKLPTDLKDKFLEVIRKTRPKKQGAHTTRTAFQPTQIRLFQGTGNDPLRPAKLPPGEFYTTESRALDTPFEAAVIHFYEGRTMWPVRQQGGAPKADGPQSNAPICVSYDRIKGDRYDDCKTCPNAAKKYNEGGCAQEVTVSLVDRAFTGIYSLTFNKSSYGTGNSLVKIITKSDNIWSRWIKFETEARTMTNNPSNRYYVIKASPVSDPKTAATPPEANALFESLSRIIDADVYFPALANTYDSNKGGGETVTAETATADAILGDSAAPDYGSDSGPNF